VDSEGLRTRLATHADVPAVVETLGLAFYDEELLLDSGLWADAPHSRVVVARFLRLRALRVDPIRALRID